jgi:hypothetical protein
MTGILMGLALLAIQTSDRGINANSTAAGFIVIALIAMVLGVMAFVFVRTSARRTPRQ